MFYTASRLHWNWNCITWPRSHDHSHIKNWSYASIFKIVLVHVFHEVLEDNLYSKLMYWYLLNAPLVFDFVRSYLGRSRFSECFRFGEKLEVLQTLQRIHIHWLCQHALEDPPHLTSTMLLSVDVAVVTYFGTSFTPLVLTEVFSSKCGPHPNVVLGVRVSSCLLHCDTLQRTGSCKMDGWLVCRLQSSITSRRGHSH